MSASSRPPVGVSAAPLFRRSPAAWRAAMAILFGLVFWLDTLAPTGVAVPMLYVVPVLLLALGGRPKDPLIGAALATVLTLAGVYLTAPAGHAEFGIVNRLLELITIWIVAAAVAVQRVLNQRWADRAAGDRTAVEASVRGLEEIRYALDQAAIVAATDQSGRITYVNDKFCEISKYSRDELLGQDHRIINSSFHSKEFIRDLWRTIAQGRVWRGELRNRAKDGTFYWVDTTIVPFLDAHGKPRQYLAIRSDITQRKAAEARLRDESALKQLGQLAAVVAHEVRNPLAGLRGSLEVLSSRLPAAMREREVIRTMIERIDSLNSRMEDILVYARPRGGPQLQPLDLGPLVAEAAASARAATGGAGPPIDILGESAIVNADPEMLRPVVLNLLINACQASGDRPVEVTIATQGADCRLAILDRGDGIPAEMRERMFEPFQTSKRAGTGLGLAIVKRLTELQGGAVKLYDREGGGTVAEVVLPLYRQASHRAS